MPRPSPFLLHGWLAEWWRHYGEGAEFAVQVARRDGRLAGALPLVVRRRAGVRVASFMGGRTSVLPDVLLAHGADPALAGQLLERLRRRRLRRRRLPRAAAKAAASPRRSAPASASSSASRRRCWTSAPGWDAVYRDKTNAKKRNLHRRRRRQLGELGELTVSVARELPELQPRSRRPSACTTCAGRAGRTARASRPRSGMRFQRAALARLAAIDVPRIVTLRLDGRAIAFHYWFALEGCMYVHRLAFDPGFSRWSPGLVNTLDAIESAAEEGLTRVEFLGGGERYKLELADGLSPLYHGFGLASGARGRAYAAAPSAPSGRACGSSSPGDCTGSTSRGSRPRGAGCGEAGLLPAVDSLANAVRGEAAARDEARDRPEAPLGGEADEQEIRVARAELAVEHRPAVAQAIAASPSARGSRGGRARSGSPRTRRPRRRRAWTVAEREPDGPSAARRAARPRPRSPSRCPRSGRAPMASRRRAGSAGPPPARGRGSAANASGLSASRFSGGGP